MMNVFAYHSFGRTYLCEFRNDYKTINFLIDASLEKEELDTIFQDMCDSAGADEKWNKWVTKTLDVLQKAGCTIIWD